MPHHLSPLMVWSMARSSKGKRRSGPRARRVHCPAGTRARTLHPKDRCRSVCPPTNLSPPVHGSRNAFPERPRPRWVQGTALTHHAVPAVLAFRPPARCGRPSADRLQHSNPFDGRAVPLEPGPARQSYGPAATSAPGPTGRPSRLPTGQQLHSVQCCRVPSVGVELARAMRSHDPCLTAPTSAPGLV